MIIVDTSVWSLAFRRKQKQADIPVINQSKALIEKDELLAVPGIVLPELLTGLKEEPQFNRMYMLITGFSIVMAKKRIISLRRKPQINVGAMVLPQQQPIV